MSQVTEIDFQVLLGRSDFGGRGKEKREKNKGKRALRRTENDYPLKSSLKYTLFALELKPLEVLHRHFLWVTFEQGFVGSCGWFDFHGFKFSYRIVNYVNFPIQLVQSLVCNLCHKKNQSYINKIF